MKVRASLSAHSLPGAAALVTRPRRLKDVNLYSGEEAVRLLIGNKDDNEDLKVVDTETAREFAKDNCMLFLEVARSLAP